MWENLLDERTKNADGHRTLTLKITARELGESEDEE